MFCLVLKVLRDAVFEHLCLADIDNLFLLVFHDIHARFFRERQNLLMQFFAGHRHISFRKDNEKKTPQTSGVLCSFVGLKSVAEVRIAEIGLNQIGQCVDSLNLVNTVCDQRDRCALGDTQ